MKDQAKYNQMVKLMSAAKTPEALNDITVLYIFDPSFDRGDIAAALSHVECEKGWKH